MPVDNSHIDVPGQPTAQHDMLRPEGAASSPLHLHQAAKGRSWAQSVLRDLDRLAAVTSAAGASQFLTPAKPEIPVGGRFKHFTPLWAALLDDPFCTSVLHEGVVPQLKKSPPYRGPPPLRPLPADQVQPMRKMLRELLELSVIQELTPDEARSPYVHRHQSGLRLWRPPHTLRPVFSTYFLVPKKDGGARGCLDLRAVNEYVECPHFRMEGLSVLKSLARPGDFMASLDVRHAYLHCPLHPAYSQIHRFRAPHPETGAPTAYEFTCQTFGLRSAPAIYGRLCKPVVSFLRRRFGIRLVCYCDDWCILGRDADECRRHTATVAATLQALGFVLHPEKSQLEPVQHGPGATFLGMECDLRPEHMVLRLTRTKRHSYRRSVQRLLSSPSSLWSARSLAQTLGKLVSAREAVEGAMYRCRSLQRVQTEALGRGGWDRPCQMLSPECLSDLQWWDTTLSAPTSCRMKLLHHEETIDTDSSPWGWGAYWRDQPAGGLFTAVEARRSQNAREMMGVVMAMKSFEKNLTGKCVLIQSDNTTVVCYINRNGGRSTLLSRMAEDLWKWCAARGISCRARHLPGLLNIRADKVSRPRLDRSDSRLNPRFFDQIQALHGPHQVDLFAGRHDRHLQRYFSARHETEAAATNALLQDWSLEANPFANPPFGLISRILHKVEAEGIQMTLVAPVWGAHWFPQLAQLCSEHPRLLPQAADLFLKIDGSPLPPPRWRTAVFRIDGRRRWSAQAPRLDFRPLRSNPRRRIPTL